MAGVLLASPRPVTNDWLWALLPRRRCSAVLRGASTDLRTVELQDGVLQPAAGHLLAPERFHSVGSGGVPPALGDGQMADTLLQEGCKSWWLMFLLREAARRGTTVVLHMQASMHGSSSAPVAC
jgi:hypothetical protein